MQCIWKQTFISYQSVFAIILTDSVNGTHNYDNNTVHIIQRLSICLKFIWFLSPQMYFIIYMLVKYICPLHILNYKGGLNLFSWYNCYEYLFQIIIFLTQITVLWYKTIWLSFFFASSVNMILSCKQQLRDGSINMPASFFPANPGNSFFFRYLYIENGSLVKPIHEQFSFKLLSF